MKFSEKLTNLRKQNNKSQEQIADKLGVSRQAVSKWESGASVPDMEKMMQLCKVLNCSLEDLVDDGVGGSKKQFIDNKQTWNTYYKEVIDFVTRTLNMFWSMRLIEKIKCILEMLILGLILYLVWVIVGNIIYSCFVSILYLLPDNVNYFFRSICSFIYQIFGIIVGFVLLVHIFKIRYLDYFITIEDENTQEKTIEVLIAEQEIKKTETNERKFIEHNKNKIIIRDPKHSTYGFINVLVKLVLWSIKFMLVLFAVPCVVCFIMITFLGICAILYIKYSVFFVGSLLAILGALAINYLVLQMIYYFIFELKQSFKKIFLIFIVGLILIGIGIGISFCAYLNFDKISIKEEVITYKEEIKYEDNLVLPFLFYDNVNVVEDNNVSNINLVIDCYDNYKPYLDYDSEYIVNTGGVDIIYKVGHINYDYMDPVDEINYFLDMIKNKERLDFDVDRTSKITMTVSSETLNKLKDNYDRYYG